ncbi:hypothetical protein L2E82_13827 [Cichorium intybus]|uniref:Uncharacterized protein n=1 Tax=Cichorium intybus TaxID=13427 RepID=A0ACB9EYD8_CICIN|nr:hypothetical protein L2E82_13827 [Cichorium intybus]
MASSCNMNFLDELRRGPWTLEEDNLLINYITCHGEGHWNALAKSSGLKRTGKSCRLRWLNYLKPDIKRGNLTPQEQILILELHSKWGNRWSKIARHLPGRTDNEIKNYWRTKVQKQACHLKIDSNSKRFVETLRRFWMPRLLEQVEQNSSSSSSSSSTLTMETDQYYLSTSPQTEQTPIMPSSSSSSPKLSQTENPNPSSSIYSSDYIPTVMPENSNLQISSNGDIAYYNPSLQYNDCYHVNISDLDMGFIHLDMPAVEAGDISAPVFQLAEADWMKDIDDVGSTSWNMDELWRFKK